MQESKCKMQSYVASPRHAGTMPCVVARVIALVFCAFAIPSLAYAQTLFQVTGILNLFVGVMVAAATVMFFGGLAVYLSNLGLEGIKKGVYIMEWAVATIFVLIVLMALVHYARAYTSAVIGVVSVAVFLGVLYAVAKFMASEGKKKKEEH